MGFGRDKAHFDPQTRVFRGRNGDGAFVTPFDPLVYQEQNLYYGGNASQYAWLAPHDPVALMALFGSAQSATDELEAFFRRGRSEVENDTFSGLFPLSGFFTSSRSLRARRLMTCLLPRPLGDFRGPACQPRRRDHRRRRSGGAHADRGSTTQGEPWAASSLKRPGPSVAANPRTKTRSLVDVQGRGCIASSDRSRGDRNGHHAAPLDIQDGFGLVSVVFLLGPVVVSYAGPARTSASRASSSRASNGSRPATHS